MRRCKTGHRWSALKDSSTSRRVAGRLILHCSTVLELRDLHAGIQGAQQVVFVLIFFGNSHLSQLFLISACRHRDSVRAVELL